MGRNNYRDWDVNFEEFGFLIVVFIKNIEEPNLQLELNDEYMKRNLWDKLDDPLYIQKGSIITLMDKSVIQTILSKV